MPVKEIRIVAPPMQIQAVLQAKWAYQALRSAVELDVFSPLSQKAMSAAQLAKLLGTSEKGMELLLNAVAGMELLDKSGETYELNDMSRTYLVKDSILYFGKHIIGRPDLDTAWEHLTELVRTGKPHMQVNEQKSGEEFFKELAANIFPLNYSTAQLLANHLGLGETQGTARILDLAAGSGVWSIPMAETSTAVTVDALDFPPICDVTKHFATTMGVGEKYHYLRGNWRDIDLTDNHYKYIILGHILHSEGKAASQQLLEKCFKALTKGGKMIVVEMLSEEDRTEPLHAQLFALNMMAATSEGCVFTVDELTSMMQQAGLTNVYRPDLEFWGDNSPMLIGTKS